MNLTFSEVELSLASVPADNLTSQRFTKIESVVFYSTLSHQVDIKLANISMSVMKKKFQTNPLDHLDHSLQGDILKLEALGEEKKNKHKARNETSSFRWSNSLVEVELPDQVFSLHHSNQWH